jgi:hypothetical protein
VQVRQESNDSPPPGGQVSGRANSGGTVGEKRGISPALVRLMAVTCAVTVANLYYAQPLLHVIAMDMHVS